MTLSAELAALYSRDLRRLAQELEAFSGTTPDSLWKTAPNVANSAGHLFLHLEGNLREFIGRQLGNIPFERKRDGEFQSAGVPLEALVARAADLRRVIPPVIEALTEERLSAMFPEPVWGLTISNRLFLVHLHGHLQYHMGQIDYARRVLTGGPAVSFVALFQ